MQMVLLIGLSIGLVMGLLVSVIIDVDSFAGKFFSMLTHGKDPHRAD
ncbi:MAG: hypothetical protein GQ474_07305 [Sulfurimonas sp.]|nr:hypothetical protein [Sulfurimonas sp.]